MVPPWPGIPHICIVHRTNEEPEDSRKFEISEADSQDRYRLHEEDETYYEIEICVNRRVFVNNSQAKSIAKVASHELALHFSPVDFSTPSKQWCSAEYLIESIVDDLRNPDVELARGNNVTQVCGSGGDPTEWSWSLTRELSTELQCQALECSVEVAHQTHLVILFRHGEVS